MRRYPPIADHGLIGDLQTTALVSSEGVVDWFCAPRPDSPSIFAALLDHERGGYFSVTAQAPGTSPAPDGGGGTDGTDGTDAAGPTVRQLYLADTAVLITRFLTAEGVGEVVDFMPVDRPEQPTGRHRLVRLLRVARGTVRFTLECRPRFDYGRAEHRLHLGGAAARFAGPGISALLRTSGPVTLKRDGEDVTGSVVLRHGQLAAAVLTVDAGPGFAVAPGGGRGTVHDTGVVSDAGLVGDTGPVSDAGPAGDSGYVGGIGHGPHGSADPDAHGPLSEAEVRADFDATQDFWHRWMRHCRYRGRRQQDVKRSAITLKLLTYAPSGAPVAAATMGLPEQLGGERNWDYRYTWVRDASLSVEALIELGFTDEAEAFQRWLGDRLRAGGTVNGEPLQVMYRVDGDPHLAEETLDHLEGYRGSAPVRLGNGAAGQLQLDIHGEAIHALAQNREGAEIAGYDGWRAVAGVLDWLAGHWDRPDEGIWETRGGRKDFTYSRVMCWAALDQGIRLATELAQPADLVRWTVARDAILTQVMERGWSAARGAFVQHYGEDVLDASLLLMPTVGFVAPRDPRWLSTLDAMDRELVSDSLVYRYDPSASPDGLRGSEGTFSLCSFLYVGALARSGRTEQARYAFDKMLTYANHVGLYAEEIGPTGEQLGNFPQAFTHLALITAALSLDAALDEAEAAP